MKRIIIRADGSKSVSTVNEKPSKTDQQYAKETDVNYILRKYAKTGQLDHVAKLQGQYADVSQIDNLDVALQKVKNAEHSFMQLPANVRKRFGNDPELMIEFLRDPKNNQEAIDLGLKVEVKKPDPKPLPKEKKVADGDKNVKTSSSSS